jgi:hypothetical protein
MALRNRKSPWKRVDPGTIVAFVALVLTQTPSIHEIWLRIFYPVKVTVSFPNSEFSVDQMFGHSAVAIQLSLRNDGGRTANIGQLNGVLSGPSGLPVALEAEQYIAMGSMPTPPIPQNMSSIVLKPGDRWDARVLFHEKVSADEVAKIVRIEGALIQPIAGSPSASQQASGIAADSSEEELKKKAAEMANRAFRWKPGSYELFVEVFQEGEDKQLGLAGLNFTLSFDAVSQMQSVINDFRFGNINIPGDPRTSPMVHLQALSSTDVSIKFVRLPAPENAEAN